VAKKLKGKVAVITGGSSGIGLSIAREFKDQGARVVICGRGNEALAKAQKQLGDGVLAVKADIASLPDIDRLFEATVKEFGKLDILVASAGAGVFLPMDQIDEAAFDLMSDVNFKGTFFTIQKALPHLNDGASIIVISANGQSKGFPGSTAMAATKAAIRSLARSVSADYLVSRGIRANCISPGPIDTPLFDKLGLPQDQVAGLKEMFKQLVPMGRMGTPEEVAKTALFLASDDSSFIVGEEIQIDGGEANLRN
jgi:NAD(P)-dependent dehydrogenase (short-subunit alcohol dehydrogenase family)